MSLKTDVKETTKANLEVINGIKDKMAVLEAEKADRSQEYYDREHAALAQQLDDAMWNAKKAVKGLCDNFRKGAEQRWAPKGEEVTPDAQLLTSGLPLNGHDLELLFDKHNGNNTMQRMINDYAQTHHINDFSRKYEGIQADYDLADNMEHYITNILDRPQFAEEINNMYFPEDKEDDNEA